MMEAERTEPAAGYEPPSVTYLGTVAELTGAEKNVGGADGATFLGVDLGS